MTHKGWYAIKHSHPTNKQIIIIIVVIIILQR